MSAEAIWHEVEAGGYVADLEVWERLAAEAGDPILELGCGTGRVAMSLARQGHEVWGVDTDPELVAVLRRRASRDGLAVCAERGDARGLGLARRFALVVAPMQLLQVLGGRAERLAALRSCAAHLRPGGRMAAAITDGAPAPPRASLGALPDVRELDGWVYSSLPVGLEVAGDRLEVRRRRETVTPDGELRTSEHVLRLAVLSAARLEAELTAAGLRPRARLAVPPDDAHAGSTVVVAERR